MIFWTLRNLTITNLLHLRKSLTERSDT